MIWLVNLTKTIIIRSSSDVIKPEASQHTPVITAWRWPLARSKRVEIKRHFECKLQILYWLEVTCVLHWVQEFRLNLVKAFRWKLSWTRSQEYHWTIRIEETRENSAWITGNQRTFEPHVPGVSKLEATTSHGARRRREQDVLPGSRPCMGPTGVINVFRRPSSGYSPKPDKSSPRTDTPPIFHLF